MAKAPQTVPTSPAGPDTEASSGVEMTKPVLAEVPAEKPKLFPVRILKGYRPVGDFVMRPRSDPENEFSPRIERDPTEDERMKIKAGYYASLPLEEAKAIIKKGIAERDDPMEV